MPNSVPLGRLEFVFSRIYDILALRGSVRKKLKRGMVCGSAVTHSV